MRKRLIPTQQDRSVPNGDCLDLGNLADVEITSEDPAYPIESALLREGGSGWQASQPGEQTIRLVFTRPQQIRRILLEFVERSIERTQEFTLSVAAAEQFPRDIVRQQCTSAQTARPRPKIIELT